MSGFTLFALALVFNPLRELLTSSDRSEYYSHIVLIPLVSAYLIYRERGALFSTEKSFSFHGLIFSFFGLALYILGLAQRIHLNQNDYASLLTFSAIVFWVGGFVFLYGRRVFLIAYFPVLFLIFMIPIPSWLLSKIIYVLQVGSTEASEILFTLTGVPFQRDGFVFHLPGISVQVAEVCSGIRSSLALLITSILAGHFFLDRSWKSVALVLFVFPVTVLKNGIRIVTLSLLGAYVDSRFLTGSFLHQSGGFLFFIPALGLLGMALWWLRRTGNGAPVKE